MTIDFETDSDGDFVLTGGDFTLTSEGQADIQTIIFRVLTESFGYKPDLDLPASLDQFFGRPSNSRLGRQIEEQVSHALTRDGAFQASDLKIDVVPVSMSAVALYIFLTPRYETSSAVQLSFVIDMTAGTISLLTD